MVSLDSTHIVIALATTAWEISRFLHTTHQHHVYLWHSRRQLVALIIHITQAVLLISIQSHVMKLTLASIHHNTTTSQPTTLTSIKTPGGRTQDTINNIYYIDQASRIGLITIVQYTSESVVQHCHHLRQILTPIDRASSTGDLEANIRADIQLLKDSP